MTGRDTEDESFGIGDLDLGDPGEDEPIAPEDDDAGDDFDDLDDLGGDPDDEQVSDDDATPLADLDGLDETSEVEPSELLVVNWSTEAKLLDLSLVVRAVLDPAAPTSTWHTPRADAPTSLRVSVGSVERTVVVVIVADTDEWIALGRDFLAGRFAVRS